MTDTVTIIIAAYQRAAALNKALQAVRRQTYPHWQALIVADHCPPEFFAQLDLSDSRIRTVNLPYRCGQQYGPNSVGLHLADAAYIAYLNHDDIWLEDHLALAVAALRAQPRDVYLGRAAFAHSHNQPDWSSNGGRIAFSEVNRPEYLWRTMFGPFYLFEPASAWVVRSDIAKRVGNWSPPDRIFNTAVMDWLMRLTRAGARFVIGDQVSVLKLNLHEGRAKQMTYFQDDGWLRILDRYLTLPTARLREEIAEDLATAKARGLLVRMPMLGQLPITPQEEQRIAIFRRYIETGMIDAEAIQPLADPWIRTMARRGLMRRTGEHIERFPDADAVVESACGDRQAHD